MTVIYTNDEMMDNITAITKHVLFIAVATSKPDISSIVSESDFSSTPLTSWIHSESASCLLSSKGSTFVEDDLIVRAVHFVPIFFLFRNSAYFFIIFDTFNSKSVGDIIDSRITKMWDITTNV
ncbi:hypothetical protein ACF0H5_008408 [Mactra antiquata]